jgi:hypothetical protein
LESQNTSGVADITGTKFFNPQSTLLNVWIEIEDCACNAFVTIHNLMTHVNTLKNDLNMLLNKKLDSYSSLETTCKHPD